MPWWKKLLNVLYNILTLGKEAGVFNKKPTVEDVAKKK